MVLEQAAAHRTMSCCLECTRQAVDACGGAGAITAVYVRRIMWTSGWSSVDFSAYERASGRKTACLGARQAMTATAGTHALCAQGLVDLSLVAAATAFRTP